MHAGKKNYTILLIDNEPQILDILEQFLSSKGFSVKKESNGQEGLETIAKDDPIDLIVMDEKMPGMESRTFINNLKKTGKEIPVINLTGFIDILDQKKRAKSIFTYTLHKPVRFSELLATVNEALEN